MKQIIGLCMAVSILLVVGCGKRETKPAPAVTPTPVPVETQPQVAQPVAPREDASFENVMRVLREALERERRENNSATQLQTARAYMLLVRFLREDKERVRKSGMTDADIAFLVDDARTRARQRLNEIVRNPAASPDAKREAEQLLRSL